MKKSMLTIIACCCFAIAFSQTATDTIEVKKSFFGYMYLHNGRNMRMKDLVAITQNNSAAYAEIKKARTSNTIGSVIGGIGGFLVGYTLGTAIAGKNPNWAVAGVGAGLIGVSVPFAISTGKRVKNGVHIYNSSLRSTSSRNIQLRGYLAAGGVGLRINF